jgi:hypothetical protein
MNLIQVDTIDGSEEVSIAPPKISKPSKKKKKPSEV